MLVGREEGQLRITILGTFISPNLEYVPEPSEYTDLTKSTTQVQICYENDCDLHVLVSTAKLSRLLMPRKV